MTSRELDNLVKPGDLKAEAPDRAEFEGLVKSGRVRLTDAGNGKLAPESRFALAYDAAHALSLAALRRMGYRPNNKRFIVFQVLPHTLNIKAEHWRVLDNCHRRRNLAEYEGHFDVDAQLLADLLGVAAMVMSAVMKLPPPD